MIHDNRIFAELAPIFTNFYEQAANFDEIIYHPEKYGTIDIRYIL